jgi:hypothetical protein
VGIWRREKILQGKVKTDNSPLRSGILIFVFSVTAVRVWIHSEKLKYSRKDNINESQRW